MSSGRAMIILSAVKLIKKMSLYKVSLYFPKQCKLPSRNLNVK